MLGPLLMLGIAGIILIDAIAKELKRNGDIGVGDTLRNINKRK